MTFAVGYRVTWLSNGQPRTGVVVSVERDGIVKVQRDGTSLVWWFIDAKGLTPYEPADAADPRGISLENA